MDWDLWGPPSCQATPERNYNTMQLGHLGFYLDHDLMDEDYLNEQACVEALRKSIERAENEIEELQKDLEFLKIQLTWADYKDWSDICCATLTEKISCLGTALQTLRDDNIQKENGANHCMQLRREPAEGIHEILKGLLMIWRQEINEQPPNSIGEYSSVESLTFAQDSPSAKWKSDARSTRMEQGKEHGFTPTRKGAVQNPSLKVDEKRKALQDVDTAVMKSSPTSNCTTNDLYEIIKASSLDLAIVKVEAEQQNSEPLNIIVENSSLEPEGKATELEPQVKTANAIVRNSSSAASKHAALSCGEKDFEKFNLVDIKKETREQYPTMNKPAADGILRNSSSDASRHAVISCGKKDVDEVHLLGIKNEIIEHFTTTAGEMRVMDSSLASGKGRSTSGKLKATDESDAMLHLPGGQKAALINEFGSSLPTSNAEETRTNAFSVVEEPVIVFSEPVAVDTEVSIKIPLLDLQEHKGQDTTMLQRKWELIPHPKHLHDAAQSAATDHRSLDFPINRQTDKRKRSFQSNQLRIATDFDLSLSAYLVSLKTKRPRTTDDNVSADQAQDNEIMKKIVQAGHRESREWSVVPYCNTRTISNLQKRKMVIDLPLAAVEDSAVGDATVGVKNGDFGIIECQSISRFQDMVTALGELSVPELKVVAKNWEVEKVWKHRKATLVQLIAMKMTSANKKG